jgi:hypothetical protein
MSDPEDRSESSLSGDPELFLIELPGGGRTRYVVAQTMITVDPDHSLMGIPWNDLAALFRDGHTLRAVPVPGKSRQPRPGHPKPAAKIRLSLGDDPGSSANLEIDIGSSAMDIGSSAQD